MNVRHRFSARDGFALLAVLASIVAVAACGYAAHSEGLGQDCNTTADCQTGLLCCKTFAPASITGHQCEPGNAPDGGGLCHPPV
jgi:hypothetical protein